MTPSYPAPSLNASTSTEAGVPLLSNGQYHVVVSRTGGSYSQYKEWALTRWREDATFRRSLQGIETETLIGVAVTLDGTPLSGPEIPLMGDDRDYAVHVQVHKTGA